MRSWIVIGASGLAFVVSVSAMAQPTIHTPPADLECPGDKMVWVNTRSHIYHFQGERYFGATKNGKFMCERDADREGDRPTRNGQ
ncbi:MAG TPA: hypothetical protein VJ779_20120 [Acetobacteraceae bacterium]|nr:hypothetical protein [Acetobacteraceae bacterium]